MGLLVSENFYNYHVVQLADMYISKTSEDSLSGLQLVTEQEISFDLILLSAVWMHIPDSQRERFYTRNWSSHYAMAQVVMRARCIE